MKCAVRGCEHELPMLVRYVPRLDGLLNELRVVDTNALRAHLLETHRPVPRPSLRRVS
jgi:hypothetical protein